MKVIEAIESRRTVKVFRDEPVEPALLQRLLATGPLAQNHGLTQPWRLRVLGPETREALATAQEFARPKFLDPPALVAFSQVLTKGEFTRREDYAACACAIQNIALAARAEGLGMYWSTGRHTRSAETAEVLGIDPELESVIAFLSFGYPQSWPQASPRRPLDEVLSWLP